MAGRALTSFGFVLILALFPSAARAQEGGETAAPSLPQAEAPSPPKLLGFGKGEDGTHAFLFGRQNQSPVVFLGQAGDLKELEVLGIERYSGKFVVDTLELGELVFNTTERSVIIPGEVGFTTKRPTRVMKGTPDKAVFVEAMSRMGYVRQRAPSVQLPAATEARLVARPRTLSGTADGRLAAFNRKTASARAALRARALRRPATGKARPAGVRAQSGRGPTARTKARAAR